MISDMVIYTLWYDSSKIPTDFNKPIIYVTENNKIGTFKNTFGFYGGDSSKKFSDYENLKKKYKIKWWSYSDDIVNNLEKKDEIYGTLEN